MEHVPLAEVHRQGGQGVCHHIPPAGKGLWRSKNCHYLTRKSCFLSPTESLQWSSRVKKRQTYIFILKISITWHLNKDRCADASWEAYNPLLLRRLSRRAVTIPGVITLFPGVTDCEVSHVLLLLYIHPSSHRETAVLFPSGSDQNLGGSPSQNPSCKVCLLLPIFDAVQALGGHGVWADLFPPEPITLSVSKPMWQCADNE